jgi:divalent anion:Na+ symporter, DASS family
VRSLSSSYGSEPDEGTRRRLGSFLTLTAFHGNVITSAMFVTAMAANPLAVQLAGAAGVSISWGKWALAALLTWDDVLRERTAWDTLVWFAALVMMAGFLNSLGLITWFSGEMSGAVGDLAWQPAFAVLTFVHFVSHYFFASNTAHVSAMYAAFLATAVALGTPALLAALVFGFLSSLFGGLTHYGSGPAPVLYGSGYVPLGTWWRIGAVVGAVNIVIWMLVGGAWMRLLGLW